MECHWPYDIPTLDIKQALAETDLQMLGLNTGRGNVENGDNGLSALPDRQVEARDAIDEAIEYGVNIGVLNIHVMAGINQTAQAKDVFIENLKYACSKAAAHGLTILIEPLNEYDAPGYFLKTSCQAKQIIQEVGLPNLKLMFDCYHVARSEGDVINRLTDLLPIIGHIQFASVPDRGAPDHGELDYQEVFSQLKTLGWDMPLGAEYKPEAKTEKSLNWIAKFK